jgi:hypothetical protein
VKQVNKTINLDLSFVCRILNLAARKWRDEQGLTWLETLRRRTSAIGVTASAALFGGGVARAA